MRYSKPRKLNTKRGQLKAERNPWCIKCRQPMSKHGKFFHCSTCRWSSQVQGVSKGKQGFASRSLFTTGQERRHVNERDNYPFCIHCKKRMMRLSGRAIGRSLSFRCANCGVSAVSHTDRLGKFELRKWAIREMVLQGYDNASIIRKLKVYYKTVGEVRASIPDEEIARCQCGQVRHHRTKCFKRKAFKGLEREHRSVFDDLLLKVRRRVESGLPDEVREEIVQQMILKAVEALEAVVGSVPEYVRWYKKEYPQRLSLDADPTWEERLVG